MEDVRKIFEFLLSLVRRMEMGEEPSPDEMRKMYSYVHLLSRKYGILVEGILEDPEVRGIYEMHFPGVEDLPGGTAS